jgi:hypothetical protein
MANEPREIRTPEGTFFEYAISLAAQNLAIASINAPSYMSLYKDGRSTAVPVSGVQLWEEYSPEGRSRALPRPSPRFERWKYLVLTFRAPVRRFRNYDGRWYDRWSVNVNFLLQHPAGCGPMPRVVALTVPPAAAPEPTGTAREEPARTEPYVNAYTSQLACICSDNYRIARVTAQACMLDQRASDWACLDVEQKLERWGLECNDWIDGTGCTPTRKVDFSCEWQTNVYRRISSELDCNDANRNVQILQVDTGKD